MIFFHHLHFPHIGIIKMPSISLAGLRSHAILPLNSNQTYAAGGENDNFQIDAQKACFAAVAAAGISSGGTGAYAATAQVQPQTQVQANAGSKADKLISFAESLRGKVHYKFGVNKPSTSTFDCSSFTKYVFASQGVSLKWGTAVQSKQGKYVSKGSLQKGDLIFFSVSKKGQINHVGIYIGGGKFIHNTIGKSVNGVIVSNLNSGSYPNRYITARRVL
jgi:lipoprotein Spr